MDLQVRRRLIKLCQIPGATMPLQYLSDELALGYDTAEREERRELIRKLNAISRFEHESGRPLLSALVRGKSKVKKELIENFYQTCEELGLGNAETLKEENYQVEARKACYAYWSDKENYNNFYEIVGEYVDEHIDFD